MRDGISVIGSPKTSDYVFVTTVLTVTGLASYTHLLMLGHRYDYEQ